MRSSVSSIWIPAIQGLFVRGYVEIGRRPTGFRVVEAGQGPLFHHGLVETRSDLGAAEAGAAFYNTAMSTFRPAPPEGALTLEALDENGVIAAYAIGALRTIAGFYEIAQVTAEMEPERRLAAILPIITEFLGKNSDWCQLSAKTRFLQQEVARSPTALKNVIGLASTDDRGKLQVAKALLNDKPLDLREPAGRYLAHVTAEALSLRDEPEAPSPSDDDAYRAVKQAMDRPALLERLAKDGALLSTFLQAAAERLVNTPRGRALGVKLLGSELLATALRDADGERSLDANVVAGVLRCAEANDSAAAAQWVEEAVRRSPELQRKVAGRPEVIARVVGQLVPAYTPPTLRKTPKPTEGDPRFSVVMAVYNGERYLALAIESVLAQTLEDFEFIIVDDCSSDDSAAIAQRYAASDPRIRLLRNAVNGGQSVSFNKAIELCRGNYVAFIDADDLWFPDKLTKVRAYIETGDSFTFLQHNMLLMFDEVPSRRTFRATLPAGDYIAAMLETNAPLPGPFTPTSGTVFPLSILQSVGSIPAELRVCSDGFLTRAAAALGPVASMATPLGYYRLHGDNATIGNDDYDGSSYVSRVLAPLLTDYYHRMARDIRLPGYRESRRFLTLRIPDGRLQQASEMDIAFERVWTLVATGYGDTRGYSPAFLRMVISTQAFSDEGDYTGLNKNVLANRVFSEREQQLYLLLDCVVRLVASDNRGALTRMERFPSGLRATLTAQALASRLHTRMGMRGEVRQDLSERIGSGAFIEDDMDLIADAFARQETGFDAAAFLQVQRALAAEESFGTSYFDNTAWVQERLEVVGGYERVNFKTGAKYRGFSVREIALSSDENVENWFGAALWQEAKLLDLPGPTVLAGEWLIRTLDGYCLSDFYLGTPHHRGSSYGSVTQTQSDVTLLYPSTPQLSLQAAFLVGGDRNYYHWVLDVLPRLFCYKNMASTAGLSLVTGVIDRPFQRAMLAAAGVSADAAVQVPYPSSFRADRLLLPLLGPPSRRSAPAYSALMRRIHNTVGAAAFAGYSTAPWSDDGERVFLLRGKSNHRTVINEADAADQLRSAGWKVVDSAALTFAEQVAAFNGASVIAAAHGAGLANLAFCRPGTRVVELAFPRWAPTYFETIAIGRELSHSRLLMREVQSFRRLPKFNHGFISDALLARVTRFGKA